VKKITVKWRVIMSLVLTKMADILLSAKTTLPTLMNAIGAPSWMLGLLVPIRESGSLLPQALMGAWLKRHEDRRKPWLISALVQTSFIIIMIVFPLLVLPTIFNKADIYARHSIYPFLVGLLVLISVMGLSLARAMTSLTMKDIQGEHLPKGMRGNVVGISSTLAGVLSLLFAGLTLLSDKMNEQILLLIGGVSVLAMMLSIFILKELDTRIDVDAGKQDEASKKNSYSTKIKNYTSAFSGELAYFIAVRGCFVHTALIAPFFIIWSTKLYSQNAIVTLSSFIIAQGAATICSSYIWGSLSDRNAKLTMQLGTSMVLVICISAIAVIQFDLASSLPPIWIIIAYFLLSIGHEGTRSGRKVYALDIKEGADRTDFIGKANTAIGIVIILLGGFYSLLTFAGELVLFSVMGLGLIVGLLLSIRMKNEK
jgi:hypothetical protein